MIGNLVLEIPLLDVSVGEESWKNHIGYFGQYLLKITEILVNA
jgi:hypothetical protein